MRIYVARHGLTNMNKQGLVNAEVHEPLAPEGIQQARTAAKSIPKSVRYIYSSPQRRATQTAEIFKALTPLPLSTNPGLAEIRMGTLAGQAWQDMPSGAELKRLHRGVKFDYEVYGGESLETVIRRLKSFISMIDEEHDDDEVLIVTHGGIIRVLRFLESQQVIYETEENTAIIVFDTVKILDAAR